MKPPETYAEWVNCFKELQRGENEDIIIASMKQGTISWTSGVAERFIEKLGQTIDLKLKKITDILQRDLNNCRGNETLMVAAILSARKSLSHLLELAFLPVLQDYIKEDLNRQIHAAADKIQESLEKTSKTDISGKITMIIKNNAVNKLVKSETLPQTEDINKTIVVNKKGRRVILP